ncbi:unknown [Clostridium sp. CAG:575]|nr:unknown [Clostridium sp. CAG:575]
MVNTNQWEWNAGGLQGSIFSGVNSRYFDTYTGERESARVGDALGSSTTTNPGAAGWHSASYSDWVYSSYPYFIRGKGGIFSFDRGYDRGSYYARGVVVCGAGL